MFGMLSAAWAPHKSIYIDRGGYDGFVQQNDVNISAIYGLNEG